MATRRIRRKPEQTREILLETAKTLLLEEGYAAVSTRQVAKIAGVSSTLVHYYYPTTDDLFVALYRHTIEEDFKTMQKAITSADPLAALWAFQTQSARAVLGAEFLALANRRAVIREEIVQYVEHARNAQVQAILGLLQRGNGPAQEKFAVCVTTMLTCISRVLITEEAVGVGLGHAETRAFVEWMIKDFLVSKPSPKSPNGDALSNLIMRFAAETETLAT